MEHILEKLRVKIASSGHLGMTDFQKWAREQLGQNEKTTLRNVQKLDKLGFLKKKKFRGYGKHERYYVSIEDDGTSHKFYMKSLKDDSHVIEETQEDLAEHIQTIVNNFRDIVKQKNKEEIFSVGTSNLLWAVNDHSKLSFCIYSGWFGTSKKQLLLAKENKKSLEDYISEIMWVFQKTGYDEGHTILHIIYNIIDSQRVLTHDQMAELYGYTEPKVKAKFKKLLEKIGW